MGKTDFINKIAPLAVQDMKNSGVLASVTIAQAILESGWGGSELAVNALNFFGMKSNLSGNTWEGSVWDGTVYSKVTKEYVDGAYVDVTADFRKYKAIADSVADHSAYLLGAKKGSQLRYAGLKGEKNPQKAIEIIKAGGYATAPDYVSKVMNIITTYGLTAYDVVESEDKTMANKKVIKIMLDAGHYGKYNRSPAVNSYYESDFNFKFTLLLKAELEALGFVVGVTRTEQGKDLGLYYRGAASAGYDLFLSIHSNAVGSGVNDKVDYPVVITLLNDNATYIDDVSRDIGNVLAKVIQETMDTNQPGRITQKRSSNDRDGDGIYNDEWYGVLYGAKSVGTAACIVEHSFHTNTRSTNWLLNDANLKVLAKNEAKAIADYYGVTATEPSKPAVDPQPKEEVTIDTSVTGSLEIIYKGADGVEIHNTPDFEEGSRNRKHGPVGPATGKGTFFTVVGKTSNGMYKLKSGLYITANEKYVKFTAKNIQKDYQVGDKVTVNGTLYGNGNGSGGSVKKVGATMYVCDIVSKDHYQYYIGLANKPGGTRIGWSKPSILS